jgi:hypothetical protein
MPCARVCALPFLLSCPNAILMNLSPNSAPIDPIGPNHALSQATPSAEALPYWIPAGVELDNLPPELVKAIAEVINPAYRELVVLARPGLAQSTGLTVVHLLWLEIIDHLQLAGKTCSNDPLEILGGESRQTIIARHLRLVHSKLKASEFLLRLNAFKSHWPNLESSTHSHGSILPMPPATLPAMENHEFC